MALNGEWLLLVVMYALHVEGDEENLQRVGYF